MFGVRLRPDSDGCSRQNAAAAAVLLLHAHRGNAAAAAAAQCAVESSSSLVLFIRVRYVCNCVLSSSLGEIAAEFMLCVLFPMR
jgi:hypothetical protein